VGVAGTIVNVIGALGTLGDLPSRTSVATRPAAAKATANSP